MSTNKDLHPEKSILIVDDDTDTGFLLSSLFRSRGYQVTVRTDGSTIQDTLKQERPDLILLDIMMPDMDGWEVYDRIQEVDDIPVIFLSALDAQEQVVRALESGAVDYVRKPFSTQELVARIESVLKRAAFSNKKGRSAEMVMKGMITDPRVSLIIPTLNEAANLPLVLPHLPLESLDEVILVDGRSTDDTVQVARRLLPSIKVVLETAKGKGAAMNAGYQAATGDIIIVMDADGSHDPREIPRIINALLEGSDFVKGSRFAPGGGTTDMPRIRQFGNWGLTMMVDLLFNGRLTDLCYGYHGFWRYCLDCIDIDDTPGFEVDTAIYVRAIEKKLRITEVPSFEGYRFHGQGKLQTFPDGFRVLKTILSEFARAHTRAESETPYLGFRNVLGPVQIYKDQYHQ